MGGFTHGDTLTVFYEDTDDDGNTVWVYWFDGEYLTAENVGNGRELRIKNTKSGDHIRLEEQADDIKIEKHD